jgi:hypothetical protein
MQVQQVLALVSTKLVANFMDGDSSIVAFCSKSQPELLHSQIMEMTESNYQYICVHRSHEGMHVAILSSMFQVEEQPCIPSWCSAITDSLPLSWL